MKASKLQARGRRKAELLLAAFLAYYSTSMMEAVGSSERHYVPWFSGLLARALLRHKQREAINQNAKINFAK
jgi:hypothetical protein